MSLDLEEERRASAERRGKVQAEELLRGRALMLRRRASGDRNQTAMELWPHFSDDERAAIVARADEMDRTPTTEARVTQLSTDQVKDIARAYLQKRPDATASEVWHHVCTQGSPAIKRSSFCSRYMTDVRKELGLSGSAAQRAGGRRSQRAQRTTEEDAPAPAPGSTPSVDSSKNRNPQEPEADPEVGASEPPAPAAEPSEAPDEPEAPEAEPVEMSIELRAIDPIQLATALRAAGAGTADREARDAIAITTPGGSLHATEQGSGWWHVQFDGPLPSDLFRRLLEDVVSPFTGGADADRP